MPKEVTAPDGMKSVKEINTAKRIDEQISKPGKYEITDNDTFKVEFFILKKENRWLISEKKIPDSEFHWVEFRMWCFEEDIILRKQSSSFDPVRRIHFIDNDMLNRLKVQRLLKSWSFEANNARLKILHVNGVLSDESYHSFMKLHPNIIRYVLNRMNDILESNG